MPNAVTQVPAATPEQAAAHFEAELTFETDCWDTHEALRNSAPGFRTAMALRERRQGSPA
jgi:hypothetical protein